MENKPSKTGDIEKIHGTTPTRPFPFIPDEVPPEAANTSRKAQIGWNSLKSINKGYEWDTADWAIFYEKIGEAFYHIAENKRIKEEHAEHEQDNS